MGSVLIWLTALGLSLGVVSPVRTEVERDFYPSNFQYLEFMTKLGAVGWRAIKNIPVCSPAIEKASHSSFVEPNNLFAWNSQNCRVGLSFGRQGRRIITDVAEPEILEAKIIREFLVPFLSPIIHAHNQAVCWGISGVLYRKAELKVSYLPCVVFLDDRLQIQNWEGNVSSLDSLQRFPVNAVSFLHGVDGVFSCLRVIRSSLRIIPSSPESAMQKPYLQKTDCNQQAAESPIAPVGNIPSYRYGGKFYNTYVLAFIATLWAGCGIPLWLGCSRLDRGRRASGWSLIAAGLAVDAAGCLCGMIGCLPWDWRRCLQYQDGHGLLNVSQEYLTAYTFCNTVRPVGRLNPMANVLSTNKQISVIGALAEGSSIRSIERMTGVHRDTIMRLGVRVGQGCAALLDAKMRDLPCRYLQFDEVWGFIGKKERHLRIDDDPQYGDVWTFCAIDADTKIVPSFRCGKRDHATAKAFVSDVASRMRGRVQISSDALRAYADSIEQVFGSEVDFGQIIKTYEHDHSQHPELKYSAPTFVSVDKRAVTGSPDMDLVSTSYIERLNATTRLHMRRLTRLTLAFSKKFENFEAAVALHFAYYNFVKRHNSLRCTPAMAAGIERDFLSVGDLVEAAA